MTFRVIAEADAKKDWNDAVDWYEGRELGVGLRFDKALRDFLQTLARDPVTVPACYPFDPEGQASQPVGLTRFILSSMLNIGEVKVRAIWHGARNPDDMRRRLKSNSPERFWPALFRLCENCRHTSRHRQFIENFGHDGFAALFLRLGFVGDRHAVAQDVHADALDVLRRHVAAAAQEGVGLGGQGERDGGAWARRPVESSPAIRQFYRRPDRACSRRCPRCNP